jgi:hypothetical protein
MLDKPPRGARRNHLEASAHPHCLSLLQPASSMACGHTLWLRINFTLTVCLVSLLLVFGHYGFCQYEPPRRRRIVASGRLAIQVLNESTRGNAGADIARTVQPAVMQTGMVPSTKVGTVLGNFGHLANLSTPVDSNLSQARLRPPFSEGSADRFRKASSSAFSDRRQINGTALIRTKVSHGGGLKLSDMQPADATSGHERGVWSIGGRSQQPRKIVQPTQTPNLRLLAFKNNIEADVRKAGAGASMGELVFFNTVLSALQTFGFTYDFAGTHAEFERLYRSMVHGANAYDIIITDTYSLGPIESYIAKEKCKFRIVDYWGTPPIQNGFNFNLSQFWTPFDFQHPPNYRLGYMIELNEPASPKKWQGLVWGKEPRYFTPNWHIIRRIAAVVPLIMTAKEITEPGAIPPNVTNLGIVSQAVRTQLLAESLFIIGLGDPVLGATPLEAIASGAAYINPQYRVRKNLWENSVYRCMSQHTFAEELGPPFVYNYRQGDAESAVEAVRRVLDFNNSRGFPPYVPPQHTPSVVTGRILESIKMRFAPGTGGSCG